MEEWSQRIVDNHQCNYAGIDEFLGDAINDILGPLRNAMTGWLKTAITATVDIGRKETELMGEQSQAKVSPDGETVETSRVAVCARINVRTDPTDDGYDYQAPLQSSAEVDAVQRDSETEFGPICSSANNNDETQLSNCCERGPTSDRSANSTPSLTLNCSFASDDIRGFRPPITGPLSQTGSKMGESSNGRQHNDDLRLDSIVQNIDDEIRLSRRVFLRKHEVMLHDCEEILSESGKY